MDFEIRPDWDEYRADPSCAPIIDGQPSINVDYERYFPTIAEARDRFAGELTVKTGMEFGVQSHTIGRFDELFERFAGEWDFTILSIHQVGNQEFWNGTFQQGRTQDEYNMGYYEEMLRVAQRFDHWSVLGHLDLIKRYDQAGPWPDANARDIVAEILEEAIPPRQGHRAQHVVHPLRTHRPHPEHRTAAPVPRLGRAHPHDWQRLAQARTPRRAHPHDARAPKDIGFTEFCTFQGMEPMFHKL